ncbi:GIY-YIG nuclease family protein [Salmonella enterica subsp. enterica]|nr:GIY-YIG nuclease family protein [Salmonella enterica subsp. enterica]
MAERHTKESINEMLLADGRGISMIGEYHGAREKALFQCAYGHEFSSSASNVIHKSGCPKCKALASSGRQTLSVDTQNERLKTKGIQIIGEYVNSRQKTKLRRIACGHEWEANVTNVLRASDNPCPHCHGFYQSAESINEQIFHRGIIMTGAFSGIDSKAEFQCLNGHKWFAIVGNVKRGSGCPRCTLVGHHGKSECFVYVMQYGKNLSKIGISSAPKLRLLALKKESPYPVKQIALFKYGDGSGNDAYKAERLSHLMLKEHNAGLSGFEGATEIFNITPEAACQHLDSIGCRRQAA